MSEIKKTKFEDFCKIKLNTIEFNVGNNSEKTFEEIFPNGMISGEYLDENMTEFFSEENLKKAFGEKYKQYNEIETTDLRGNKCIIKMPSIVGGGMGIDISSFGLVEDQNEVGISGHTSSIGVGFHNYKSKYPDLFKKGYIWKKELDSIVKNDFNTLFKEKLGFDDEFINKHFFDCEEEKDIGEGYKVKGKKSKILRMMDLVTIFEQGNKLKKRGQNLMLKTSSYLAAFKVSILAGYDFVSTSAGVPPINPKIFLQGFYEDLKKMRYNIRIPAFGLVTAVTMGLDTGYDYYVYEEGKEAGGHTVDGKGLEKFKKGYDDKFKDIENVPPVYAAGSVSTNEELRMIFNELGYNGSQNGTVFIPTDKAINGGGKGFKEAIIAGNHFGEDTDIDRKFYKGVEKTKKRFESIIKLYNRKLIKYLNEKGEKINEETPEIIRVRDYLYKIIYGDFFNEEIKGFDELNENEKEYYNLLKEFISSQFNGDLEEINEVLRRYGNAKKFIKEFEKYKEKEQCLPTLVRFDSTVGYKARAKIRQSMVKIILSMGDVIQCVECLTSCLVSKRGNVSPEKASKFCIKDRLNPELDGIIEDDFEDERLIFSGRSRCFYSEIRPVRDIIAGMMGYHIER